MSSIGFVRFCATHLGQKVANSAALWLLRPLPHPPHPIPQHTHTHTHTRHPPSPSFCGLPKFQSRSPLGLRIEQLGPIETSERKRERERALVAHARKTAQPEPDPTHSYQTRTRTTDVEQKLGEKRRQPERQREADKVEVLLPLCARRGEVEGYYVHEQEEQGAKD